jgi:hypothetical protein
VNAGPPELLPDEKEVPKECRIGPPVVTRTARAPDPTHDFSLHSIAFFLGKLQVTQEKVIARSFFP